MNKSFFKEIGKAIGAFITIFVFIKKYKNTIISFIGIGLLTFQSFKIEHIDKLLKSSAPLFDIKLEYTHSLTPLAIELVKKCGKHCFFGIAFLKYEETGNNYIGTNLELFGINENNIVSTTLTDQLYNSYREIKYGKCTSKLIDEIMNSTHGTTVINIHNLLKKCPEDVQELNDTFFYPQTDEAGKHIACGNWRTIVNKVVVSVLKSSIGHRAYVMIWLSQTNPIIGNLQCTVDYQNFMKTGCDKDDCENDMRVIAKKGKEFTNEYGLR